MNESKRNNLLLVIDDESAMRTLLHDFLRSQGYEVSCFSSALEALKDVRKSGAPAAIISDVRMYPMDGIHFLIAVKRDFPKTPVLLFTGEGDAEQKSIALSLGAAAYLQKPFALSQVKHFAQTAVKGASWSKSAGGTP